MLGLSFDLVGTNPRYEAPLLNARIRKAYTHNETDVGVVGDAVDLTYDYEHFGTGADSFSKLGTKLKSAKAPIVIIGSQLFERSDADAIFAALRKATAGANATFNVLHQHAGTVAALDIGYNGSAPAAKANFVYLLGVDSIPTDAIADGAFVVYQGSHGDAGAALADVILPGAAYTEKDGTYVNTEGRAQTSRAAVTPPGLARTDWKIIRAVSEVANRTLPYDTLNEVRSRLGEVAPCTIQYDAVESANFHAAAVAMAGKEKSKIDTTDFSVAQRELKDYYLTDPITRASPTMAKCVRATQNPMSDKQH